MKPNTITLKSTLLVTFLFAISTVFAQTNTITIDNDPQSTTTHKTIQEALNAAGIGDIIYVQPSATTYGTAMIDKAVTIIGRSHSETGNISSLGTITVRSSGVSIKGVNFSSLNITSGGSPNAIPYTGLRIYECKFSGVTFGAYTANVITVSDVEIRGCVFTSINQYPDSDEIIISNNVITSGCNFYNPLGLVISNNIFRPSSNLTISNHSTTDPLILFNNMYIVNSGSDRTLLFNSGDFNISNSLTHNFGGGNFIIGGTGSLIQANNLLGVDPSFVDVDTSISGSLAGTSTFNPTMRMDDLKLQGGSLALTGSIGGDEIGLFANGFNFKYLGVPRGLPVLDVISYDGAVSKDGSINVTISAKAH